MNKSIAKIYSSEYNKNEVFVDLLCCENNKCIEYTLHFENGQFLLDIPEQDSIGYKKQFVFPVIENKLNESIDEIKKLINEVTVKQLNNGQ